MKIGLFISMSENICERIRQLHSLGFDNCQLGVGAILGKYKGEGSWDELADQINAVCEELGFKITAVHAGWTGYHNFSFPEMYRTIGFVPTDLRAQRTQEVLHQAEYAQKLHVKNIFTHIGYLHDDPTDEQRQSVVVTIRYIADRLGAHGQCFLIETGEIIPVSLVQLIHEIGRDNVGINFDPANFLINGRANPSDALDMLLPYVKGMHAKDAVYPTGTTPKGHETPIGEGMVDFEYIIRKLHANGYDGYVSIEREIRGEQQLKDILKAAEYLRGLIATLG